ncbi:hypothetical protein ACIBAH_04460 [Streptomyces sp. NPDC051445]|uniref:hypothetical protein n=1 Tax=Streptomyces sp. NPDC051445 TaxID=3365653 RepID=UPI0037B5B8EB
MSSNVSVAEAAALADLYWPKFVEYRDGVFLGFKFDRNAVDDWFDHLQDDVRAVESVVNHVHLWDYFVITLESEYAALPALAESISVIWRAAAQAAFPDREFEVGVSDGSGDYGPTLRLAGR